MVKFCKGKWVGEDMMKKANLLKMVHLAKGLEKFSDKSSKAPLERDEFDSGMIGFGENSPVVTKI